MKTSDPISERFALMGELDQIRARLETIKGEAKRLRRDEASRALFRALIQLDRAIEQID